jgi:hypothetical protein
MDNRLQEALRASQADIITAAEAKLSRPLSTGERAGIERVSSLMTLESVYRSFTFPDYSAAQVESDLRHFASQPQ